MMKFNVETLRYVRLIDHKNALKKIQALQAENARLKEQLSEFKVFGTDECPDCERAPVGANYNRTTLFYRPKEHELHLKELKGEKG